MIRKLLASLFLLAGLPVAAQEYIPLINSTSWNINVNNFGTSVDYWLTAANDTVIGAHTYTQYVSNYIMPPAPQQIIKKYYIREEPESKRVYQWREDADKLIFDFSLEVGDDVELANGISYTVMSKDSVAVVTGRKRVKMYLDFPDNSYLGEGWIEGVGNYQHPFRDNFDMIQDPVNRINCNYNSDITGYNRGLAYNGIPTVCPQPPGMGVTTHNAYRITFGPNPFSHTATVTTNYALADTSFVLYNPLGRAVKEVRHLSGKGITVSREGLPEGLYYLRVTEAGKVVFAGSVIVAD